MTIKRTYDIAIDYDGTCVKHRYPNIGEDIGAIPILKKLVECGHYLILFTMRSGKELDEAVNWFMQNEIPLCGINTNPTQHTWTASPKAFADLYIDDCGLGIPLIYPQNERPHVNWNTVESMLIQRGILYE